MQFPIYKIKNLCYDKNRNPKGGILMDYMPFVWLGVIVLAIVFEASTAALVSIWFIPAAFVSLILSFFPIPLWVQILVFAVISTLLVVFMKVVFKKTLGLRPVATNADAVIGEEAVVTEAIDNLEGHGQVKVRGQIWTARSYDKEVKYEKGEIVNVVSIEGVKLICKK